MQNMAPMTPQRRPGEFALTLADIALRAGAAILDVRDGTIVVARKSDDSPVTEADRKAEDIILEGLAEAFPTIPVISEEAAEAGALPMAGERFFLVDPLDGTREFVAGRAEFTVNIALIEGGRPVAGVVLAPALGLLALTDSDCGAIATELARRATLKNANWRPLATRLAPAAGLVAVASRSHRDAATDSFLTQRGITDTKSAGSSLKFVSLAGGEADVYPRFGRTMEWDTAAGHAVLAAAGGAVLTLDGAELRYGKSSSGFANPAFIAWGRQPAD